VRPVDPTAVSVWMQSKPDPAPAQLATDGGGRLGRAARFAAGCAAILTLTACEEGKNVYVPPPPPKVLVAQPVQEPVTRYIELTGNTKAFNQVDLEARVQGFLEQINYQDGTLQKKDTVLFVIQQNTYQAQLEQAKASVTGAQAELKKAQAEFERQADLVSKQVSTQANYDKALAQRDSDQANVQTAQANNTIAEINLGYTTVKAPFDGIVARHLVSVGALVGYGGPTKLASIVQVAPIYVYFNVSETLTLRIQEGLAKQGKTLRDIPEVPVEIGLQIEDGYPHVGRLDYVAPSVDPSTGTLEARAVFENKDMRLMPGLFVRVRIPVQKLDKALLVADTAIGTSQIGKYLLVVGKDNTVEQRPVQVGQLVGGLRVIESGLTADDWVVTGGTQRAIPGNKIDPERKQMAAAGAAR
jgi:membrane fusion protein, multidrug efflux system